MKIKFRLAIIAVIAMISSMVWAQETFPVKTDKYGFYSVQSTPTSVAFIKASTEENEDGSRTVNIYRGRELAQSIVCDVTSGDLHFFDANFDGNLDIMVGPAESRNYSTILLWDDARGEFVAMEQSEPLNGYFMVDPKHKQLISVGSSSYCSMYYEVLQWKGKKLVAVESLIEISDPTAYGEYGVSRRYTIIKGNNFEKIKANLKSQVAKRSALPQQWKNRLNAYEDYRR